MKTEFMTTMKRSFYRVGLKVQKHSPEILLVGGIVTGGAALVAACRATTKIESVMSEAKANAEQVHECAAAGEITVAEGEEICTVEYTEEDSKKDLTIIYAKTGVKLAKLYAPAIVLGGVSLTCILASHGIIHKRNIALASAYTAVDSSFKDYRKRVVERFGEELDRELKYNIKAKEVEETIIQEDGTETVVKKTVEVADLCPSEKNSQYARFFGDGNTGHTDDPEANLMFLRRQEKWANQRLQEVGHLFLNEVYDMLGIPRSTAGQIVGWVYDKNGKNCGDNYVDFGIYRNDSNAGDFVAGIEEGIWLDFNVDGPIYQLIG